ncbi:Desmoglein-1-beta [Gossypium arboreum]|uniref:Desmoglein-1-beta n=1 Tax=Gossypium arboreum TaxID=29729 RepID=A0A0B0MYY7_GOSAR|nr:Desmoglein-1-beta [Gossypium arboreum]KHG15163.1 Desmoglein-1-beta [Gossypium arboreum]
MALVVYWYDFICFGVVAAAFIGSLWVLWKKEAASRCDEESVYESLLEARPDADGFIRATPRAHVGSNQLWTSCWIRVHPGWLVLTRFVSFAVMAGFLVWDIVEWDASIFVYYTDSSCLINTCILFVKLGTAISAYGCWVCFTTPLPENSLRDEFVKTDVEEGRIANSVTYQAKNVWCKIKLQSHYAQEEFQRRAGFWGYLMQIIYQTCGGAVILTDIVFWLVIVPFLSNSHLGLNMLMGCMHTVNAVLLILDTLFNSLPFPWFRLAYFVQWSCLYAIFQWVLHACGFTWWPYPFLELNTPWAPLWYFSMAVVHIPCYGIYALIVKAKNSILPRLFPHDFVRSY